MISLSVVWNWFTKKEFVDNQNEIMAKNHPGSQAAPAQRDFKKELREFRKNYTKYGVVEKGPGGYFFRLRNDQFGNNPQKSPFGY